MSPPLSRFQQTESQRTHRQYASDTNQAVVHSMVPFPAFLSLPKDWSLEQYPEIDTDRYPSQIESYTDVTAHNFDSGDVYRETLKAFKGTAPTDDGLVPHSSLSVGTHTVSALLAGYATGGQSLAISQRTKSTLMLDQADEQTSFLDVYKAADSEEARSAITEHYRRGGSSVLDSKNQGSLNQVVSALSDAFVGVVLETDEGQSPSMFGDDSDDSSDNGNSDDSNDEDDDEALAVAFFARWDEYIDWLTAAASNATDSADRFEDRFWLDLETWMDSEKSWQDDQDSYLDDLASDWPGSDDNTQMFDGREEEEEEEDDEERVVVLGEGYDAKIDLKDISAEKLQEYVNDGTLAQAFTVSLAYDVYWFKRDNKVTKVNSVADADIIVLGQKDGPKIAVIKKWIPSPTVAMAGFSWLGIGGKTYWSGWTNAQGGLNIYGSATSYKRVAESWAIEEAAGSTQSIATGLEFTMNIIPFGAATLKIADDDDGWSVRDTLEVGVLIATDVATFAVPVAKAAQTAGKVSTKTVKAVQAAAKGADYGATALDTFDVAEDIMKQGLSWGNSAQLLGIIVSLSGNKPQSSKDVLKISDETGDAAKKGTKLNKLDPEKIDLEAQNAGTKVRKQTSNLTPPQDFVSVQSYGTPPNVEYRLVDLHGTPVATDLTFGNLADAEAAAKAAIRASYSPDRATRLSKFKNPKELAVAEYLEDHGRVVTKNPIEGAVNIDGSSVGRTGDAFVDGVKHEFKTLDPGATSNRIKNVVNNSIRKKGGQARNIVIDARGSGLTKADATEGLSKAAGISRGKLDNITIVGDGFFINREIQ